MASVPHKESISIADNLNRRLSAAVSRHFQIGVLDGLGWSLVVLMLGLLLLAFLDIVWQLPSQTRSAGVGIVLLAAVATWLIWLTNSWRSSNKVNIAKRMDAVGSTGGEILSGLDLAKTSASKSDLQRGMVDVAISRAADRACEIPIAEVVPWRLLKRSALTALAVGVFIAMLAPTMPKAFSTMWNRLFYLASDAPPYSPLSFEVEPGDASLTYGESLKVRAKITGGLVDEVELVLGSPNEPNARAVSMFQREDGWQAVVPRIQHSTQYFVRTKRARSEVFRVEVLEIPQIKEIRFAVTPPKYTGLPQQRGAYPNAGISGLQDSNVNITITSDRPLSGGTIIVAGDEDEPDKRIAMVAGDEPNLATVSTTIEKSTNWSFVARGANGVDSEMSAPINVEMTLDLPPVVRILNPRQTSYATPNADLNVSVVAEDDYGLSKVNLYRILDSSRPLPISLPIETNSNLARGKEVLKLSRLRLEPGDRITLFARAEDTRPGKVQFNESLLTQIEIISQRDFDRLVASRQGRQMLSKKFRQATRLLEQLATEADELQKEIENLDPQDKNGREALQSKIDQLREKMNRVADQLDELAKQKIPLDIDERWNSELQKYADALRQGANSSTQSADQDGERLKQQIDALRKAIEKTQQEQQATIQNPLDVLRKILPLLAAEQEFAKLVVRQRKLTETLESFKENSLVSDPSDRQQIVELRTQETAIRESLAVLLEDIESAAVQLGDDPDLQSLQQSSLDFVDAVRNSWIDAELEDTVQDLSIYDGADGYIHAAAALEEMEKFLKQCQKVSGSGKSCLKRAFQPGSMGQNGNSSVDQLLNQMGFNSGPGSGYSVRGNTGQNIGLYGNQPFATPVGRGIGDRGGLGRESTGTSGDEFVNKTPETFLMPESAIKSAQDIPLRYRRRTERYLRRLAEGVQDK